MFRFARRHCLGLVLGWMFLALSTMENCVHSDGGREDRVEKEEMAWKIRSDLEVLVKVS